MRRFVFLTVVALMMVVVLASPAWAETFTVDRIDDPDLGTTPTADDCTAAAANDCSLRGAITAANANAGDDTIDIGVMGTVELTGALPNLSSNIEIKGPGADQLTVLRPATAATNFRIFNVTSGSVVSISGITISGGKVTSASGGGIQSFGTLTVSDSTITENSASFGGGGILNDHGTLTVSNSTISHNSAGEGGGIITVDNDTESQSTTITNSTISGNTSATSGGGVETFSGRTTIKFSTITKNSANDRFGSGVASFGDNSARTEVLSTIISENTNTDVDFFSGTTNSFVSNGYNLIGDAGNDGNATGAFNQTGDLVATDAVPINPMLGPLADNGGPTMTHALLTDSPAIDAGPPTSGDTICPPPLTDQRGISRPQGSHCDIGAYEVEVEVDNTAPFVTETYPRPPLLELTKTEDVTATFSEPVQNVTPDTFFLERRIAAKTKTDPPKFERVNATVTPPSENSLTAVLDPVLDLPKGEYRATVTTAVTDVAGNALDQNPDQEENQPMVWTFTVAK
jgi:hypothetical protein